MALVKVVKVSISLTKQAKRHASAQARRLAKERGESRANISSFIAQLILRDQREFAVTEQKEAA